MNLFIIIPSIVFAIFSTGILSYVSMATMIGPWIAPTLVLMSGIIFKFRIDFRTKKQKNKEIALIQTAGSVGGIIGMGVGFSLPTLYFLDPVLFNNWISKPFSFCFIIAFVCFSAGGLGIWLARCFADKFIKKENLSFPVSQLIYKMITSQSQSQQAKSMFLGFSSSWIICFLRDGIFRFKGFLPKVFYLFQNFVGKEIAFSVCPMLWAIGFIAGIKIVFPLLVGMLSKYFIIYPINNHSFFLPFKFFSAFSDNVFITAFCSGLVVSEFILGNLKYPKIFYKKVKNFSGYNFFNDIKKLKDFFANKDLNKHGKLKKLISDIILNFEAIFVFLISIICLSFLKFSFLNQALLFFLIIVFTYQISYLGGKIGLITFGRFATFIMIPMMLIFKLNFFQITFICVFFNICAGVASDLLFDYKVGQLCEIDFKRIRNYQWLGLIVTSLCVGIFLWLLFTNFQLGSADLFAQRGKSRALLIQSLSFDWRIVLIGFFYGFLLKKLKISPTMVFGGILMPNNLTIGLVIGAVSSCFFKRPKEQFPLWSGVFAGESIWILFSIFLRIF